MITGVASEVTWALFPLASCSKQRPGAGAAAIRGFVSMSSDNEEERERPIQMTAPRSPPGCVEGISGEYFVASLHCRYSSSARDFTAGADARACERGQLAANVEHSRAPDTRGARSAAANRGAGAAALTLDKCGRFYVSPPFTNVNVGKNPGFFSSSFTTGWVGAQPQSPAAMADVLSQGSWSVTAGFKAGITAGGNISFALTNPAPMFMTTMLVPTSVTGINNASVGPMTPQVGAMLGYNFGPFSNSGGTC
ncbi:MAG TPA: hypothetical protein VGU66_06765 [Candidatus Elarobacter sp.]|nr:hypothetical protein [Candidatus Elarobacter sp.]